MIQYIKRSIPAAVFLSIIIMAVFRLVFHFTQEVTLPWYLHLLSAAMVLGTGLVLSALNDRYDLLPERTQWIIVAYVWLVSCCPQTYSNLWAHVAVLLIAGALYKLVYSAYVPATRSGPFMSALLITCAGFLFFPAFFLYIPFVISFIRMGKISAKDLVAFAGGILVPCFLVCALLWFGNRDMAMFWNQRLEYFRLWNPAQTLESFPITDIILVALISFLVVLALFIRLVRRDITITVNVSRFYSSIFWLVFFSSLVMIAYPAFSDGYILIMMIPVSLLITSLFTGRRFFGSVVLIALLIISSLASYIGQVFSLPF